jgi:hypothetical protein
MRKITLIVTLLVGICCAAKGDAFMDQMGRLRNECVRQFGVPMNWRFEDADITNAEQPDFDDSSWRTISPRFSWGGSNTVWFRSAITVPATVGG